jgi:hypothetical protein
MESRRTRVREGILLGHRNMLVVDGLFREAFESQNKDNISLLHLIPSDHLRYVDTFDRFVNIFFQGFIV